MLSSINHSLPHLYSQLHTNLIHYSRRFPGVTWWSIIGCHINN